MALQWLSRRRVLQKDRGNKALLSLSIYYTGCKPKNVHYPHPASRFGGSLSQFTPVGVVIKNSHARCQTAVGFHGSAVAVAHCGSIRLTRMQGV
ncbi:MAG: hypothetical protein OEY60_15935 [Nitrospira sp.]|nr:hypothetical protein [Nitrospira sp.]MDH5726952.1 hypothetical protein [Nitrospira sp.]